MDHRLFKTKFLNGIKCYWMKREHPEHPCHQPHIGEVYCLYGKEVDWGYAIFQVVELSGVRIVRSRYHVNRRVIAETILDKAMLELGFVLKNGGSIEYATEEEADLTSWQMHFRYDPSVRCKVTLKRAYIETLDFHVDTSFLERFTGSYGDIVQPYIEAVEKGVAYSCLDYSPFILTKYIQNRLLKIRRFLQQKTRLSNNESFNLFRGVVELFEETFADIRGQAYQRLSAAKKESFVLFEENPVSQFSEMPSIEEVCQLTNIHRPTVERLCRQRHNLTFGQFIVKHWIEEAAARLRANQKASIEDIAYELGWNSPVQFSIAFKRYMGTNPSDYQLKKNHSDHMDT